MQPRPIRALATLGLGAISLSLICPVTASADSTDPTQPHEGAYGFYVDTYLDNTTANMTPETNPAIGVLSPMLELWRPGTSWNNGTALDKEVLDLNIAKVVRLTTTRTEQEETEAYLSDRRNQNYTMLEGFGSDRDTVASLVNAGTTIPDAIPADATSVKYEDKGNASGTWGDGDAELGSLVDLVNTVRGPAATSNRAKEYYQYMRPFRWSSDVDVLATLRPAIKPESDAANDGGFPSGHTNAAFLAGYAYAAAAPEHYADQMLRASQLGRSRVVAGMHNTIDVMGGRTLATAIAASSLSDPANAELVERARADVQRLVKPAVPASTDRDAYQADLSEFHDNVTFGFAPDEAADDHVRVPKGAEALLRSRLPYLDDAQIRWVLASTALEAGYPTLDDEEGWGRLNLFAAAHGYASFDRDVSVTMDASSGGFSAADVWLNDIDGAGGLTKDGTGSLTLAGLNSYEGTTTLRDGTLVATTSASLGTGDADLTGGTLRESTEGTLAIGGDLTARRGSTLSIGVEKAGTPAVSVDGDATLSGTLAVDLGSLAQVPDRVALVSAETISGAFDGVTVEGAPEGYGARLVVDGSTLYLVRGDLPGATPTPEPSPTAKAPSRPGLPSTGAGDGRR